MIEKTKQFNNQQYKFEVTFIPYEADPVPLNPDSVVQLVLEDQIINWASKGFIVFQNFSEMFQRKIKENYLGNTNLTAKQKRESPLDGYIFRNDGKDRIEIKIKPIKNVDVDNPDIEEPPDENWLIYFKGNVYDFEEPMVSDFNSKIKKIYFWHENWQKMIERNLLNEKNSIWSTANSKLNPNFNKSGYKPSQATDEERKMFTGDAIKDILQNFLNFKIDDKNFDKGRSKIFYTPSASCNCWDAILYIWKKHLSEIKLTSNNYDICLFLYDRYKETYQFMPLSKLFEKAGNDISNPGSYQIEHLLLEDVSEKDKTPANQVWMAPILKEYDPNIDVKVSKLKKYSFTEMSAVDSIRDLITTSIFAYDRKNKTFSKNCIKSQIKDVPKYLQNDYIKGKLYSKGNDNTQINLNNIKIQNLKTKYKFTPISDLNVVERLGHGNLMFSSIFFNLCLTVELEGSTHRKVGKFIGVDRLLNNENEFDYQLGGQWLITRVNHNFFRNTYSNELQLIKPHVYDKIKFNKTENVE